MPIWIRWLVMLLKDWRREKGKLSFWGRRGDEDLSCQKFLVCIYIFEQEAHSAINLHTWAFYWLCLWTNCVVYGNILKWNYWNLQDLEKKPKYLVTFTVGIKQRNNINAAVKKVIKAAIPYFFTWLFWYSECWRLRFFFTFL